MVQIHSNLENGQTYEQEVLEMFPYINKLDLYYFHGHQFIRGSEVFNPVIITNHFHGDSLEVYNREGEYRVFAVSKTQMETEGTMAKTGVGYKEIGTSPYSCLLRRMKKYGNRNESRTSEFIEKRELLQNELSKLGLLEHFKNFCDGIDGMSGKVNMPLLLLDDNELNLDRMAIEAMDMMKGAYSRTDIYAADNAISALYFAFLCLSLGIPFRAGFDLDLSDCYSLDIRAHALKVSTIGLPLNLIAKLDGNDLVIAIYDAMGESNRLAAEGEEPIEIFKRLWNHFLGRFDTNQDPTQPIVE